MNIVDVCSISGGIDSLAAYIVCTMTTPHAEIRRVAADDGRGDLRGRNIRDYVKWAMTSRGGVQYDLEKLLPPKACSSSYGLCE